MICRTLLFITFLFSFAADAARLALVIGNDKYGNFPPHRQLLKAGTDATTMARELAAAGFDVVNVARHRDLGYVEMVTAVDALRARIRPGDEVVVFFSGHGVQIDQNVYWLPSDLAYNATPGTLPQVSLPMQRVMDDVRRAGARFSLFIADACRENPFPPPAAGTKSAFGDTRGLSFGTPPEGQVVLLAASKDELALDRLSPTDPDPNGVFTRTLIKHIRTPGLTLTDLMRRVAPAVRQTAARYIDPTTGRPHTQRPAMMVDNVLSADEEFRFYPSGQAAMASPAPPQVASSPPSRRAGEVFKDCADCPELVVIPAGSFTMGSGASEQALAKAAGANDEQIGRESPQHTVNVKSFAAGRYAVTRGEFGAFVQSKGYKTEAELDGGCVVYTNKWEMQADKNWRNVGFSQGDDHPVVCVSWNDAKAYVQWLSETSGKGYRLLTEAEREYATRGGTTTAFWWGDSIGVGQANYDGNYTYNGSAKGEWRRATVAVNTFKANPFGLYNVHGNVREWVEDCFHDNYSGAPTDGSAWTTGCSGDTRRVIRGGSWFDSPVDLRSAFRGGYTPVNRLSGLGFRIARTF
jgi:formylglycine-generating enzyme required for sulfatase activity